MLLRSRPDPLGFIEPCAPVLYEVAPAGPDWLHEIKHDGWRMVARKDGDRVACGAASARIGRRTSPRSLPLARICRMSALCSIAHGAQTVSIGGHQRGAGLEADTGASEMAVAVALVLEKVGEDDKIGGIRDFGAGRPLAGDLPVIDPDAGFEPLVT